MAYFEGDDFINGAILSYQQGNRMKNNWRGAAYPTNIQPGMIFSSNVDDRLYHRGAAAAPGGLEEIIQLTRSRLNAGVFEMLSLNIKALNAVCVDNNVVCVDNAIVFLAIW